MKYIVKRQHFGDKEYREGDEREISEASAQPLIAMGLLTESSKSAPEKSVEAPKNKALKAPKNK